MSTLKDVAELAGVSSATVSLVLNGKLEKHKISPATRERVLSAARELRYTPNIAAKRLKMSSPNRHTIAVCWPADYRTYFVSKTINGLEAARRTLDADIDILIYPYENDRLSQAGALSGSPVYNGAIIVAPSERDMDFLERTSFEFPVIVLNRHSDRFITVGIDNYEVGRMAAEHLLSQGYTNIATVFSSAPYPAMNQHRSGFMDACGRFPCVITMINTPHSSMEDGFSSVPELLDRGLPQAVFYDSDAVARGALCAFNREGVSIPGDVAVFTLGVGASDLCEYSVPPLSAIEIPHDRMAEEGLRAACRAICGESVSPEHILLQPRLVIRASCP